MDKVLPLHGDVGSFRVVEKECPGSTFSGKALTLEETDKFLMNDSEDCENFGREELSNFGGGYMDVTSFDYGSLFNDGSWLNMVNDSEDCENFGREELSNFGSGYMDVTSFDYESLFNDGSWLNMVELVDKVANSNNNVETMQNMSCSKALGKRKTIEAPGICSKTWLGNSDPKGCFNFHKELGWLCWTDMSNKGIRLVAEAKQHEADAAKC